jgi:hypothetical protein
MKFGSCLLAVLALEVLSMNSVLAGHRSHGSQGAASHHHFTTGASPLDKPQAVEDHAGGSTAKQGSRLTGDDKAGEDERSHPKEPGKPGVSSQSHGVTGKDDAADRTIDTRVGPRQLAIRSFRQHQPKAAKGADVNVAAGNSIKSSRHQHFSIHHPNTGVRESRRNALGTLLNDDKTTEHRNAVGTATPPTPNTGPNPQANSTPPATGAPIHDPNADRLPGKDPVNRPSSGPAFAVATSNGMGIGGTGFIRPGSGAGTLGGSARITPGVISGNNVHLKRP